VVGSLRALSSGMLYHTVWSMLTNFSEVVVNSSETPVTFSILNNTNTHEITLFYVEHFLVLTKMVRTTSD
jgi:hypothetical protein